MSDMNLEDQIVATLKYTGMKPGGLKFLSNRTYEDGVSGQTERGFYTVKVEDVSLLGDLYVVEFTRYSSWDDNKETGPMMIKKGAFD